MGEWGVRSGEWGMGKERGEGEGGKAKKGSAEDLYFMLFEFVHERNKVHQHLSPTHLPLHPPPNPPHLLFPHRPHIPQHSGHGPRLPHRERRRGFRMRGAVRGLPQPEEFARRVLGGGSG